MPIPVSGWASDQLALVDDHDVVADALDVFQDVRGDDDGDPEHPVDAVDQLQHLLPALRVHPVGRLVEEDQTGSWTIAWASLTRCFIPVEKPLISR